MEPTRQKVITSKSNHKGVIRELIQYRDLFFVLAYRDLRVRYAQTVLGLLWAILQPLTTLMIFVLIFGRALKVETGGVPYVVFALGGMSAWSYFSFIMAQSGQSILGAQEMIKKIYFPRLIIPLSKALVAGVDFLVAFTLLLIMIWWHDVAISPNIIYLPIFILLTVLASLGTGIWLSALSIRFRDIQHIVPFMVQVGLYVTPVAYPMDLIPQEFMFLYHLNPMAGLCNGFRWSILGIGEMSGYTLVSMGVSLLLFVSGVWFFKRVEKDIADLI